MELKERFLSYVAINTQSDEGSSTYPSTQGQITLLEMLASEMKVMGLEDVEMDKYGYVMGTIPASKGCEMYPTIGFIAHVDTSPDMSSEGIKPRTIENYDGSDIELSHITTMSVKEFPELKKLIGHTIIHTDGTTLLGADDKAGAAEIMCAAERLLSDKSIRHGKIRLGFTPDEEIGKGVDFFDVRRFGADVAYTMDGGAEGELEYENFYAASATFTSVGRNIHPGYAKGKMVNAITIAREFDSILPQAERPEFTSGYEGFYHCVGITGTVETAEAKYIIREHDAEKFEARKMTMWQCVGMLRDRYGMESMDLKLKDQYLNMRKMIEPHPEIIDIARRAMEEAGVEPKIAPIRGGTDGARLSYMGLPCPNIFTGGGNFHGRYEYCSLTSMERAVEVIINIAKLWAK
ncbi:MAG: peptidase T [Rikenellaceae bacterium]